jgi:hypothetical protein
MAGIRLAASAGRGQTSDCRPEAVETRKDPTQVNHYDLRPRYKIATAQSLFEKLPEYEPKTAIDQSVKDFII